MSGNARFHDKLHRANHHTLSTGGLLDSAYDPIASPEHPFRGDFILSGSLSALGDIIANNLNIKSEITIDGNTTTQNQTIVGSLKLAKQYYGATAIYAINPTTRLDPFTLSINYENGVFISNDLYVNGIIYGNLPTVNGYTPSTTDISIGHATLKTNSGSWVNSTNWVVSNSSSMVVTNLVVLNNLTALGSTTLVDLSTSTSDSLCVVNVGLSVPALYAEVVMGTNPVVSLKNTGSGPILSARSGGSTFVINNSGWIGIGGEPSTELDLYPLSSLTYGADIKLRGSSNSVRDYYISVRNSDLVFSHKPLMGGSATDALVLSGNNLLITGDLYLSGNFYGNSAYRALTSNWQNTYTAVSNNSANWQNVYSNVSANSANWSYQGADLKALSGNWQNTYNTVKANSGSWSYQGTDLKALTANYDSTFTTVKNNSALWDVSGSDVTGISGNWQNTYVTVSSNSANWSYQGLDLKALTGNYDSTFTTVKNNSGSWGANLTTEDVQDTVSGLLSAGKGITLRYADADNKLEISTTANLSTSIGLNAGFIPVAYSSNRLEDSAFRNLNFDFFINNPNASIYTGGNDSPIYTKGANSHIYTNSGNISSTTGNLFLSAGSVFAPKGTVSAASASFVNLSAGYTKLKSYTETNVVASNTTGTCTIDLSLGTVFTHTLAASITTGFQLQNIPIGVNSFLITLTQDGTGGKTVNWSFIGKTVKWSGGAPTVTSTANATDIYSFMSIDGNTWYGSVAGKNFV
jgi:hypothetical protein